MSNSTSTLAPVCITCGTNASGHSLYRGILHCPSCGLVFADTQLGDDELRSLYQEGYFLGDEYSNYVEDKPTIQRNFRGRIKTLRGFSPRGDLFEIGCAYGFFLELAAAFWNVRGCDISPAAVAHAQKNGWNAVCDDVLNLNIPAASMDVVTMWDTIEHLARPDLYIAEASRALKTGGHLALTTGDIGSGMARFRKERWRLIHPPTHLFYFDRASMTRLLDKHGLEVVHFEHCGYYRSLQQVFYSLLVLHAKSPARERLYSILKTLLPFALYLNLYDIMYVIARKR